MRMVFIMSCILLLGLGCAKNEPNIAVDIPDDIRLEDMLEAEGQTLIKLRLTEAGFDPNVIVVRPNQELRLVIEETQGRQRFVFEEKGIETEVEIGSQLVFFAPSEAGDYPFFGSALHNEKKGILRVTQPQY